MEKLKTCKHCGAQIAKNAKFCPNCGGKNKKPIFLRWWFFVLVILVIIVALGGKGSSKSSETQQAGTSSQKNVESALTEQSSNSNSKQDDPTAEPTNTPTPKPTATPKVKEADIRRYINDIQERGKYTFYVKDSQKQINCPDRRRDFRQQVSNTTINNYLRNLNVFFVWLDTQDVLALGNHKLHKSLKTCCEAEGKVMKRSGKPAKKTQ